MSEKFTYKRDKDEQLIKHRQIKQLSFKKAAPVIGAFAASMVIYYVVGMVFKFKYIVHIYGVAMLVSGILAGIFNHGFAMHPPKWEDMPEKWSDEHKQDEINKYYERRRKANPCIMVFIAIALTFACDLIYLYYIAE